MPENNEGSAIHVDWGLVIHGGVGVLPEDLLTPTLEAEYRATLTASLQAGFQAMEGGSAADGVVASIEVMEDSVLFNAGRGSNFTTDGLVSMDASIMTGNTLEAGAVAGVAGVRNPIRLAKEIMQACPHVMLSGAGAENFARERGLRMESPEFFFTQRRWDDLQAAKTREAEGEARPNTVDVDDVQALAAGAEPSGSDAASTGSDPSSRMTDDELRHRSGTVGAVALDRGGLLVAGTSTGGSANKKWGRIGDSPVIAAGTYAGSHCGVSCTGWGEYFIRHAVAHDIQARMAYLGISLREAARQVVMEVLEDQRPGLGGLVAMDREGNVEMSFNTRGMYRGWVDSEGRIEVGIF
jgi:beta-aspartyl-peptidase (threonine type)